MSFPFIFELFIVLLCRALTSLPPPRIAARACGCLGKGGHISKLPGLGSKAEGCMSLLRPRVRPLGKMFPASNLVKHSTSTCPGIFVACSHSPQLAFFEGSPIHTHLVYVFSTSLLSTSPCSNFPLQKKKKNPNLIMMTLIQLQI